MDRSKIFEGIDKALLARFKEYHLENPYVYEAFRTAALQMRHSGRKKYSAWTIINRIRWDFDIETKDKLFKINNDFIGLYARLLIYHQPDFNGFFDLREMKRLGRAVSDEERERVDDGKHYKERDHSVFRQV